MVSPPAVLALPTTVVPFGFTAVASLLVKTAAERPEVTHHTFRPQERLRVPVREACGPDELAVPTDVVRRTSGAAQAARSFIWPWR
jgi:hypothetical protein